MANDPLVPIDQLNFARSLDRNSGERATLVTDGAPVTRDINGLEDLGLDSEAIDAFLRLDQIGANRPPDGRVSPSDLATGLSEPHVRAFTVKQAVLLQTADEYLSWPSIAPAASQIGPLAGALSDPPPATFVDASVAIDDLPTSHQPVASRVQRFTEDELAPDVVSLSEIETALSAASWTDAEREVLQRIQQRLLAYLPGRLDHSAKYVMAPVGKSNPSVIDAGAFKLDLLLEHSYSFARRRVDRTGQVHVEVPTGERVELFDDNHSRVLGQSEVIEWPTTGRVRVDRWKDGQRVKRHEFDAPADSESFEIPQGFHVVDTTGTIIDASIPKGVPDLLPGRYSVVAGAHTATPFRIALDVYAEGALYIQAELRNRYRVRERITLGEEFELNIAHLAVSGRLEKSGELVIELDRGKETFSLGASDRI